MACTVEPFDRHPARPGLLEADAGRFVELASEAVDLAAVTDAAFRPAPASWDGVAAAELRDAPEPVRRAAEETSSRLAWAAVPLRYWADRVRTFNTVVDRLREEYETAGVGIAGHNVRSAKRREWEAAYQTYIVDGAREVAAMLRDGPTYQHLALARRVGLIPATAVITYFAGRWEAASAPQEALDLARRINAGHQPSEEELSRLVELLERYGGEPEFAHDLLTGLGPQGLLRLTAGLGLLAVDDPVGDVEGRWAEDWVRLIGDAQGALGVVLATATTPGAHQVPEEWVEELMRLGRQPMWLDGHAYRQGGFGPVEIYGYQALGVLLKRGDYDSDFLARVGGDILDFELGRGGSDVWYTDSRLDVTNHGMRLDWIDGASGNAGFDPVPGLLAALGRNPEAARSVFIGPDEHIPAGPVAGRFPRLTYLLTEREWTDQVLVGELPGSCQACVDQGMELLGEVLKGAAVSDPDERSARLVEAVVYELNRANGATDGPLIPPPMRAAMGEIVKEYLDDINRSLTVMNVGIHLGVDAFVPGWASDGSDVSEHDEYLARFIADVGKDPKGYATVAEAQAAFAVLSFDYYLSGRHDPDSTFEQRLGSVNVVSRRYGEIMGILDYGLAQAEFASQEERDLAVNQANEAQQAFVARLIRGGVDVVTVWAPKAVNEGLTGMLDLILSQIPPPGTVDNSGGVQAMVAERLSTRRNAAAELTIYALYDSGLLRDVAEYFGDPPTPRHAWEVSTWEQWYRYLTGTGEGHGAVILGGEEAGRAYQEGYEWAEDLLGDR